MKGTPVIKVDNVGSVIAKQLEDAFIPTAELLAVQDPLELKEKAGITEGKCVTIIANARKLLDLDDFKTGLEIEAEESKKPRLTTGIKKWDDNLRGGFKTGSLIEYFAPASGGKTQFCAHLAVRAMLPKEQGGLEGRVLWMDTEKGFDTHIFRANMRRWGLDPEVGLLNIGVSRIDKSYLFEQRFEKLPKLVAEDEVSLVVIDSLTGKFRQRYQQLGGLLTRQGKINDLFAHMRDIATATDAIFVYTNQVMDKPGRDHSVVNAPTGGHIVSHGSDYRFRLSGTSHAYIRTLKLVDHAGLPDFSIATHIRTGGIYGEQTEWEGLEDKLIELSLGEGWDPPKGTYAAAYAAAKTTKSKKKANAGESA